MSTLGAVRKAVLAFVAPGAVSLLASLHGSSDGGSAITQTEWTTAALLCVVTAAGVYAVPNATPVEVAEVEESETDG